jgi:hypothetical protein
MAHHVFRRCLLVDVVPPPPIVVVYGDYRLFVADRNYLGIDSTGVEVYQTSTPMMVLGSASVIPIPPGTDTGNNPDRLYVEDLFADSIFISNGTSTILHNQVPEGSIRL